MANKGKSVAYNRAAQRLHRTVRNLCRLNGVQIFHKRNYHRQMHEHLTDPTKTFSDEFIRDSLVDAKKSCETSQTAIEDAKKTKTSLASGAFTAFTEHQKRQEQRLRKMRTRLRQARRQQETVGSNPCPNPPPS